MSVDRSRHQSNVSLITAVGYIESYEFGRIADELRYAWKDGDRVVLDLTRVTNVQDLVRSILEQDLFQDVNIVISAPDVIRESEIIREMPRWGIDVAERIRLFPDVDTAFAVAKAQAAGQYDPIPAAFAEELASRRTWQTLHPKDPEPLDNAIIYISDEEERHKVESAVEDLASAFGWVIERASPGIEGSWFKSFRIRVKDVVASDEGSALVSELRRAGELRAIHEVQSRVDDAQSTAAARLIESLANTQQAALFVGSILVIKNDGRITVLTLSPRQMIYLEQHPDLINDPGALLRALQASVEPNEITSPPSSSSFSRQLDRDDA